MSGLIVHSDRSQLPDARVEGGPAHEAGRARGSSDAAARIVPVAFERSAAIPPISVGGDVGGPSRHAPSLAGRAGPAPAGVPGNRVESEALRSTQMLNQLIGHIESTRRFDAALNRPVLSGRAKAVLDHLGLVADACEAIAGGPAIGETLLTQMARLEATTLEQSMEKLRAVPAAIEVDAKLGDDVMDMIAAWTEEVSAQAEDRVKYLAQSLQSSPLSLSKMYDTKAKLNSAAAAILDNVIKAYSGDDAGREVLVRAKAAFETRMDRMSQASRENQGKLGSPRDVAGTNKLTGYHRLLSPLKARAEEAERKLRVLELLSSGGREDLNTPGTSEKGIVKDALAQVLKEAKVVGVHAEREVDHAFSALINSNPAWQTPVRNEIHLPAVATSGASEQPVPAGDLPMSAPSVGDLWVGDLSAVGASKLSDKFAVEANPLAVQTKIAVSEISPAPVFFDSYQGTGVNSHCSAEGTHAVNLAHTRLVDAEGNVLFSGARHGVFCAFGIHPAGIEQMKDNEVEHLIRTLLPPDAWRVDANGKADMRATKVHVRKHPELVDQMRHAANRNRAAEVVALTVMTDPALCRAAVHGGRPTVDILSVSLLTPDVFRRDPEENETAMLADQAAAWKAVSGVQTIQIRHPETGEPLEVEVNVRPVPMNYGVNAGAFVSVLPALTGRLFGWNVSNALNVESLHTLFGRDLSNIDRSRTGVLGERIAQLEQQRRTELTQAQFDLDRHILRPLLPNPPRPTEDPRISTARAKGKTPEESRRLGHQAESEVRDEFVARAHELRQRVVALENMPNDQSTPLGAALELTRQIAAIHRDVAYRKEGSEPYKMPTRLAVLADLLGVKVAFNCKSGKDRTGELDTEIKHMKLQMAVTGKVPHYTRERTPEEKRHFHEVATNSGNFEIQQLNTGYTGYKLNGVNSLFSQFGSSGKDDELGKHFHGLSSFTLA